LLRFASRRDFIDSSNYLKHAMFLSVRSDSHYSRGLHFELDESRQVERAEAWSWGLLQCDNP